MGKEKEVTTNAMRILKKQGIAFEVNTYDCNNFIDGVHIADQLGQPYEKSFKPLVAVGKSKAYYVFVLPVDREIDFKKAARIVGEKTIQLISVKEIQKVTGYIRGGCTPVGMKKAFPTYIEESAKAQDQIIISGGKLGVQLILQPDDLLQAVKGTYADFLAL